MAKDPKISEQERRKRELILENVYLRRSLAWDYTALAHGAAIVDQGGELARRLNGLLGKVTPILQIAAPAQWQPFARFCVKSRRFLNQWLS